MGPVEGSRGESGIDGSKGEPGQMGIGMGQVDGSRSESENKGTWVGQGRWRENKQRIRSRSSRLSAGRG